jgi:hypothetical protein
MNINQYINDQLSVIENPGNSPTTKAETLFNLIAVLNFESVRLDLYTYVKKFILYYLDSVEDRTYGYDTIDKEKIIKCIECLNLDQQVRMLKFLNRNLKKRHIEETWEDFALFEATLIIKTVQINKYWLFNPWYLLKVLYFKALNSIAFLLVLLFTIVFVQVVILLPNPSNLWPSLFVIEYQPICKNFFLNHVGNILLNIVEIDSDFKIKPIGFFGVLLLVSGAGFKILILIKFVFDSLLKKIEIHE